MPLPPAKRGARSLPSPTARGCTPSFRPPLGAGASPSARPTRGATRSFGRCSAPQCRSSHSCRRSAALTAPGGRCARLAADGAPHRRALRARRQRRAIARLERACGVGGCGAAGRGIVGRPPPRRRRGRAPPFGARPLSRACSACSMLTLTRPPRTSRRRPPPPASATRPAHSDGAGGAQWAPAPHGNEAIALLGVGRRALGSRAQGTRRAAGAARPLLSRDEREGQGDCAQGERLLAPRSVRRRAAVERRGAAADCAPQDRRLRARRRRGRFRRAGDRRRANALCRGGASAAHRRDCVATPRRAADAAVRL